MVPILQSTTMNWKNIVFPKQRARLKTAKASSEVYLNYNRHRLDSMAMEVDYIQDFSGDADENRAHVDAYIPAAFATVVG